MILLAGADIVLPDRLLASGSVLIDGDRIAAIEPRVIDAPVGATSIDLRGMVVVPGFIDVHVHGIEGHDVLDGVGAVAEVARRLPRYGVTAFCPTSVACDPQTLKNMLAEVASLRARPPAHAARVLPAHLESNFINPDFNGAQPAECLRVPRPANRGVIVEGGTSVPPLASSRHRNGETDRSTASFTSDDILATTDEHRADIGVVTIAPEIDGGFDLVRRFAAAGHIVSIGHSGATYEQTLAAIDEGVSHATHLFNRMSPMSHRAPGIPGAVLQSDRVTAEVICDGFHVHPALMQLALQAKGPSRLMAITDGTAGSGLPAGARARLGGRTIVVTERTAELEDGTLAGSVLTMDAALRMLVQRIGVSLVNACLMCATTPAAQLGLSDRGRIAVGAAADLAVLDSSLRVHSTFIAGVQWRNSVAAPLV